MKKLIYLLCLVCLSLISFNSFAARIDNTVILGIQNGTSGDFIITLPPNSDPKCTNGGVYFYVAAGQNGLNSDGVKVLLSLALVAYSSGVKVHVVYDNSTQACFVSSINVLK